MANSVKLLRKMKIICPFTRLHDYMIIYVIKIIDVNYIIIGLYDYMIMELNDYMIIW